MTTCPGLPFALCSVARSQEIVIERNTCTFGMFASSSDNDLIDCRGMPLYANRFFYVVDTLTAIYDIETSCMILQTAPLTSARNLISH